MKILITYSSKTGNTEKVAKAIFEEIPSADFLPISEVKSLDYDLIIIGGWIDRATFDNNALVFSKNIMKKNVAYFFTLGAYPNSAHALDCVKNIDALFNENENIITGKYFCQGAIDPKLISWLSTLPSDHKMAPSDERRQRWEDAKSHPNSEDLERAKEFAKSIL
ncbi:flavodoxin [Cetobacterium sp. 8H]|uniref:flavodoxin family protein n=1 Tax=Cetobacterium sp. 8H TaxID=2759681 RepID=UPI00163D16C6|nr:flavodoxin family protein [Cetobacterium sp. 8H]MBC2851539.1 flavodoxin [Cetobacterium sp. 8H]